ncbi:thioester reductase domain-containing protein [Streptomyces sp. NPDC048603]|uniref:thioester reductase domain-containing protein n=1 Tax=Streptomyces sp. NPDC048603 TaxID=3365577 RepID=UPI003713BC2D
MRTDPHLANDPLSASWTAELRSALRVHARRHLPEAMVPAHFVVLPALPRLPNGKVDRGNLPAFKDTGDAGTPGAGFVAPRDPLEARIAGIWQDLLGVANVDVETGFFDLGGDSLTVLQMAAQVRDAFGVRLDLRRLFEDPTVSRLAALIGNGAAPDAGPGAGSGTASAAAPGPGPRTSGDTNPRGVAGDRMAADAALPADIRPGPDTRPPVRGGAYRSVLLTGGTGYTGAFLLRELLERSRATLHVLVRATGPEEALERVLANLEEYGLLRPGDRERLRGVPGDTGRPYLGMGREDYHRLAAEVEMIVHNAAVSSWVVPYSKIKPVNVLGAQEVLRLACRTRVKAVHFVSTTGVYPGLPGTRCWAEAPLTGTDGVVGGYRQSKWVADSLMLQARERGVPAHVYRLGAVTGARDTGACSEDTFINHLVKGCVQLGAYLDFDLQLELVPVDYCAAAIAHVAVSGGSEHAVFNVPGAHAVRMNDVFELVSAYGYRLRRLPYREWYRELSDAVERGEENELAVYLPLFGPEAPAAEIGRLDSRPVFDTTHLTSALDGSGISCPPVGRQLFDTYLDYFVSTGFLPPPADPRR